MVLFDSVGAAGVIVVALLGWLKRVYLTVGVQNTVNFLVHKKLVGGACSCTPGSLT